MAQLVLIFAILKNQNHMIIVESKRKKIENIKKNYPDAIIHDVTSHSTDEFIKFSPFYPHGGIPVPFTPNMTAMSVESIWQGLKDYDSVGIDTSVFRNGTMRDIKRTKRKYGNVKGHRKGVFGKEHLGYIEARKEIYVPTYKWMLDHKVRYLVERLKKESIDHTVVLLDYDTNPDVENRNSPLSHASLIKAYVEGYYPNYGDSDKTLKPVEEDPVSVFSLGDKVKHPVFGEGVVKALSEDRIIVTFNKVGEKLLARCICKLEKK